MDEWLNLPDAGGVRERLRSLVRVLRSVGANHGVVLAALAPQPLDALEQPRLYVRLRWPENATATPAATAAIAAAVGRLLGIAVAAAPNDWDDLVCAVAVRGDEFAARAASRSFLPRFRCPPPSGGMLHASIAEVAARAEQLMRAPAELPPRPTDGPVAPGDMDQWFCWVRSMRVAAKLHALTELPVVRTDTRRVDAVQLVRLQWSSDDIRERRVIGRRFASLMYTAAAGLPGIPRTVRNVWTEFAQDTSPPPVPECVLARLRSDVSSAEARGFIRIATDDEPLSPTARLGRPVSLPSHQVSPLLDPRSGVSGAQPARVTGPGWPYAWTANAAAMATMQMAHRQRRQAAAEAAAAVSPQDVATIDWAATTTWRYQGQCHPIAEMPDGFLWELVIWLVRQRSPLYVLCRQSAPEAMPQWLAARPLFRALVRESARRCLTYPDDVFAFFVEHVFDADKRVDGYLPWRDPAAAARQAPHMIEHARGRAMRPLDIRGGD